MKKLLISITLIIALLCCFVSCDAFGGTDALDAAKANAAAVFTLDVNPGVRVYVDAENCVIAVEATNADGEKIAAEIDAKGKNYEVVVEEIIDAMEAQGYIVGEESSILVSLEKKHMDIAEKINAKIEKAFEKHGKRPSFIEQDIDDLDDDIAEIIIEMAKKYNISEGKAHLIEKIREEFPELSEEDLASLKVNELAMMLAETSEDVKGHFNKIDKPVDADYIGKEQALVIALESLELTAEDVTMTDVDLGREHGKMVYEVEFVYDGMEYEIEIDAKNGEILESESEEFEEFDAKGMLDDFCNKHNIKPGDIMDLFGKGDHGDDEHDHEDDEHEHEHDKPESKPISKGELLKGLLGELKISDKGLKKTEVEIYETEIGIVFAVTLETVDGDVYSLVVEAYTGVVIKAEFNGEAIEGLVATAA